jgi:hypothetical protein
MTWTPASLRQRFGDVVISMAEHDEPAIHLGRYLDLLMARDAGEGTAGGPPNYLRNIFVREALPDLVDEIEVPFFARDNVLASAALAAAVPAVWAQWLELFISGKGTRYPSVHVDTHQTHAWLMQVYGTKSLWVWPPRNTAQAARIVDNTDFMEITSETCLDDLMDHARPTEVKLAAGDVIFIPAGWWHTVEATSLSVTVSGNFVNASNWDDFYAFNRFVLLHSDDEPLRDVARAIIAAVPDGEYPRS